jgi:hypothetical protein
MDADFPSDLDLRYGDDLGATILERTVDLGNCMLRIAEARRHTSKGHESERFVVDVEKVRALVQATSGTAREQQSDSGSERS